MVRVTMTGKGGFKRLWRLRRDKWWMADKAFDDQ